MLFKKRNNFWQKIWKITVFILTVGLVLFVLWKVNWLTFKEAKSSSEVTKKNSNNEQYSLFFFFKMKDKIWIKPTHKNFWKKQKIFVNEKKLSSWRIRNYLNFFWKDWQKYFWINSTNLEKMAKKKNFIVYQPLNTLKIWKQRSQVNINNLAKINLSPERLRISLPVWKKIIEIIKDSKNSFFTVKVIINYYCQPKSAKLLIQKLTNNIWDW